MLDLKKTLTCGQCFRWKENPDGSWTGVVNKKIYNLSQNNPDIIKDDEFLFDYFDMARDYDAIDDMLARDDVMKKVIPFGKGIRILNQDFFETLMSFIVSQNNNIPRIQGCIEKMCELFGEPIGEDLIGKRCYSFPTAERLANLKTEDLAPVRLGYRDKFIIESARQYLDGNITELTDYQGVGPKVASCTELFGKHNLDAFPIDVWVKRVMNRLYGFDEKDVKSMAKFAEDNFSPYGGIAQQYLFYYIREMKEE